MDPALKIYAPVAQLDRASACGAGDYRFESYQAHHPTPRLRNGKPIITSRLT